MSVFVTRGRGVVTRISNGLHPTTPFFVAVDGELAPISSCLISQVGFDAQTNFQVLHTFDDTTYTSVFGDKIGDLRIGGVAYAECPDGSGDPAKLGCDALLDWFARNKVTARRSSVVIGFANRTIRAICTGMHVEYNDADNMLGQFALRFSTFPSRNL